MRSRVVSPVCQLVNLLVITETGLLKPIAYDFDGRFDVASVDGLSSGDLRYYKQQHLPDLQALISGALTGLRDRHDLVDWFDNCTRLSEVGPLARPAVSQQHKARSRFGCES